MEALKHLIIAIFFCGGIFAGSVLIDLDHLSAKCSPTCLANAALTSKDPNKEPGCEGCERGFLHNPLVMMCMMALFLGLGIGVLLHILTDFTRWV